MTNYHAIENFYFRPFLRARNPAQTSSLAATYFHAFIIYIYKEHIKATQSVAW